MNVSVRRQRTHELTKEYAALLSAQAWAEMAGNDDHAQILRRLREEVAAALQALG